MRWRNIYSEITLSAASATSLILHLVSLAYSLGLVSFGNSHERFQIRVDVFGDRGSRFELRERLERL